MMDFNQITEEILVRYVLGEASPAERIAVQEWINLSHSNKSHLDELKMIWKESGRLGITSTVTSDEAWERFRQRTINKPGYREFIQLRPMGWLKAAAILLLLAGGGWLSWQTVKGGATVAATQQQVPEQKITNVTTAQPEQKTSYSADSQHNTIQNEPKVVAKTQKPKPVIAKKAIVAQFHKYDRTKEFICNATPCPLEICIVQTIHCSDGKPASVATCNILQPDQAGQLHYKAFDKTPGNCKATVSEIRIKRVTTGETIVLNNNTKPSTAEDLFNYLTGKRTTNQDILAGIFETDCDNSCTESKLKIGNNFGHLTLE